MYTIHKLSYKGFISNYGGTISYKTGLSKYWNKEYYKYYNIEIVNI